MIYTTRSEVPYAVIGGIHYSELTDLAWNNEESLMVSSRDGYITIIKFDKNELGWKIEYENISKTNQSLFEWMVKYWDLSKIEATPLKEIIP